MHGLPFSRQTIAPALIRRSAVIFAFFCGLTTRSAADWTPQWPLRQDRPLPAPFAFASRSEALAAIFPSYQRQLGTEASIKTIEGHPAHIGVLEAKPWIASGTTQLVVLVGLEGYDKMFGNMMCGGCYEGYVVALLRRNGDHLVVAGRSALPIRSGEYFEGTMVKGDGEVALDLAPYRLTETEMLIGVRNTWSATGGYYGEDLELYRVQSARLAMVARLSVGGGQYYHEQQEATVESTQGGGKYYDLLIVNRAMVCALPAGKPCMQPTKPVKPYPSATQTYRFDGKVYREITSLRAY